MSQEDADDDFADVDSARSALIQALSQPHVTSDIAKKKDSEGLVAAYEQQIVKDTKKKDRYWFKMVVMTFVLMTFVVSVLYFWYGLSWVAGKEFELLSEGKIKKTTVITEKVILFLISGTVIEMAIAFGLTMRFLFERQKKTLLPEKLPNETVGVKESQ